MVTEKRSKPLRHLLLLILFLFTGKALSQGNQFIPGVNNQNAPDKSGETWITIFAHGIMSIKPHVSFSNFVRLWKDDVEDSVYAKTVEYMRDDPVFYKNQAMQMPGLHAVYPHNIESGNASGALAYTINSMENHFDISPANNYFFTYGWSGLLSAKQRIKDALRLFQELEQLVTAFRQKGIEPKIRLYGYSHGGNVLLNLASIKQQLFPSSDLKVHELVLLGTPIQPETDYLINDPMFVSILHHYSEKDRVQWLDFFSCGRNGFSNQKFKPRTGFILPDKLTQIKLKVIRPARNARNNEKKLSISGNLKNQSIVMGRSHLLRDNSPGHVELWFFPWTPQYYRKDYPIYPFPTVAYTPIIDHFARAIKDKNPAETITADIRPDYGVILLRKESLTPIHAHIKLPTKEKITELKKTIYQYAPQNYNGSLYNKHMKIAFDKAHKWYNTSSPKRSYVRKKRTMKRTSNSSITVAQTK